MVLTARYPTLRHGYVIELKYLKRDQEGDAPLRSASPRPGIKRGAI